MSPMTKHTITLLLVFITLLTLPFTVSAQDNNTDQIREAVKEKVKERIQNVTTRKVGLVGTLEKITTDTLLISNQQNKLTITTDENTQYLRFPGKRQLNRDELELNQYAIILGLQESDQPDVAAKILQLIEQPEIPQRQTLYGIVSEVASNSLVVTTQTTQPWEITLSRNTKYSEKTNTNQNRSLKLSNIKVDDLVIIGGTPVADTTFTLKGLIVHRLPAKASAKEGLPQPESTPTPDASAKSESSDETPEAGPSAKTE